MAKKKQTTLNSFIIIATLIFFQSISNIYLLGKTTNKNTLKNRITLRQIVNSYISENDFKFQLSHLLNEVKLFAQTNQQRMCDNASWLEKQAPDNEWFNVTSFNVLPSLKTNKFLPYVEKLIVEPNSQIAVFGDIHGEIKTVINILLKLRQEGFLDDEFKISKPNCYMIFLGDYIDHTKTSSEVLYVLMKLYNQNPGKIWLLRGNHEDVATCMDFHKELKSRFSHINKKEWFPIFYSFDYMPLALFVGCKNNNLINYIQFCHGGFEVGYNAKNLLESNVTFQQINKLNRSTGFECLRNKNNIEILKNNKELILNIINNTNKSSEKKIIKLLKEELHFATQKHRLIVSLFVWWYMLRNKKKFLVQLNSLIKDLDDSEFWDLYHSRMGFTWNSFWNSSNINKEDLDILWYAGILNFGPKATKDFLCFNSTDSKILRAVFRAHQHVWKSLLPLRRGKGLFSLWNGKVFTLVTGMHLTEPECYRSFAIINISSDPIKWKINHFYSQKEQPFEVKEINMFEKTI